MNIRWNCFGLQFRFPVSDTVNGNSAAESVKEPVPGASLEGKQEDTGEGLRLFGLNLHF